MLNTTRLRLTAIRQKSSLNINQTISPATGIQRRKATPGRKCLNSLSLGFQRSVVRRIVLAYLSQCSLPLAKISGFFRTSVLSVTFRAYFLCRWISGRPSAGLFPPGRWRSLPAHMGKRSSPRSRLVTPAWLQSPEQLRRPGDFRSYCHAPARLWPPEPSTDSLDLTHNWPALGARLFQTGALPTHRCPVKPGKRGKRSRDCASCRRKRQPSQTLAGLIPPSLPREVQ